MPLPPRIFPGDEELGKRDDDHKPGSKSPLSSVWLHRRLMMRRNLKRIALCMALLTCLYYFFKNMPTDLGPRSPRPNYIHSPPNSPNRPNRPPMPMPQVSPPSDAAWETKLDLAWQDEAEVKSKHWFNGPIKFYELASSLHAISSTRGSSPINQNVLFAASSLKSAATLLPLACEMGTFKRNYVHFALLGREDISMELLKEVNGIKEDCDIWFHDGRPDFLIESSDYRMEVSQSACLGHITNFMHPQAVIIDNSGVEDAFFLKAFKERAPALARTLIELPVNVDESLRWIARLDSASLKAWNEISIDIIVHGQPAASGSLIRLLQSLWRADYFHSTPPHLTIELPNEIDDPTIEFLKTFRWPPSSHSKAKEASLRHRIPQPGLTAAENSIRFVESFWPADPATSHILVLSPQVEISPIFFHYLKYTVLEYKYSAIWADEKHLMGISLDLPSTYLNDTTPFAVPRSTRNDTSDLEPTIPFLWQAPNSIATLYFGDKWTELHSFIGKSLVSQHTLPTATSFDIKHISKTYPSWLEHVLSLARIRGYYTLYANLAKKESLATVHNELYQLPEEFSTLTSEGHDSSPSPETDWTIDPAQHLSLQHEEKPLVSTSLLNILSIQGPLPGLVGMPLLSWDGKDMTRLEMEQSAASHAQEFMREVGICPDTAQRKPRLEGCADDLFCF